MFVMMPTRSDSILVLTASLAIKLPAGLKEICVYSIIIFTFFKFIPSVYILSFNKLYYYYYNRNLILVTVNRPLSNSVST